MKRQKITSNNIITLLDEATNVFIHNDKLIIDKKLNRFIINNVHEKAYYVSLFENKFVKNIEKKKLFYGEETAKLILEYYPNPDNMEWLSKELSLPKAALTNKYYKMLAYFEKNNRYSKFYWEDELNDLKINKNNLEYHAKKYNRTLRSLEYILKKYKL